ncbi:hypothetical protein BCT05_10270 [Vibrio breoganii]|nr:hypothetical protein BCT97_02090 [Vibrio breoganii]PMO26310.1 hypothetical protein BCT14_15200 [Vibrio breoganii]PMO32521.1 hypothetical protein BCT13_09115 [Vibrio breoganii]PMO66137.1 hypothetical protein BCT05_10270 [Vibrio breoganii]
MKKLKLKIKAISYQLSAISYQLSAIKLLTTLVSKPPLRPAQKLQKIVMLEVFSGPALWSGI